MEAEALNLRRIAGRLKSLVITIKAPGRADEHMALAEPPDLAVFREPSPGFCMKPGTARGRILRDPQQQAALFQIDVPPFEIQQLAGARGGRQRQHHEGMQNGILDCLAQQGGALLLGQEAHATAALMELADPVEGIVRYPVPLLARHGEHVAERSQVAIDGRGAASVSVGQCAWLDRGARRPGLCACEGLAGELAAVLDQYGWGYVGELQVTEVLFPPGQIRAGGAAVALLRDLFLDIAIDGFTERAPSGLDTAKVSALDHVGFDGLGPALGHTPRGKTRSAGREAAHADLDL